MPGGAELSDKLPDELFQLVESFKKFLREQKSYRDQKFDLDAITEIGHDAEMFTIAFQRVAVDSDKNSQLVEQIREETNKLLRHAELAYSILRSNSTNNSTSNNQQQQLNQTSNSILNQQQPFANLTETPPYGSNQFGNASTSQYFKELAEQFESRMKAYGEQIKELKMSLDSITKTYNIDELSTWLKKQHETLGEIAAKVYITHERIMDWKTKTDEHTNQLKRLDPNLYTKHQAF